MNIDGVIPFDLNTALLVVITSEPFHCCWQIDFVFWSTDAACDDGVGFDINGNNDHIISQKQHFHK